MSEPELPVLPSVAGRVVHVVGARPNFIKAAPVLAAIDALGIPQRLVHTGQHYDVRMSDVFFSDLGLPAPDVSLGVGSGSHAAQTAVLLARLEPVLAPADPAERPALVIVYGDVNSTLAAAIVCAKERVPFAHVEAGLRSFDDSMPEELNRRLVDQVADLCFLTSPEALDHLVREGIDPARCHFVGNPMIDTLLAHRARFDPAPLRARYGLGGEYAVATLHRPANVDTPDAAARLVGALRTLASRLPVLLPLHPRGRAMLTAAGLDTIPGIEIVEPLGYIDFLSLVSGARVVVTDSGGIQEETTILGIPCLTLRPNTERPITISHGTNRLATPEGLAPLLDAALRGELARPGDGPPLWDGHAGERIAAIVRDVLAARAAR